MWIEDDDGRPGGRETRDQAQRWQIEVPVDGPHRQALTFRRARDGENPPRRSLEDRAVDLEGDVIEPRCKRTATAFRT
ncbi:hypothetical protein JMK10_01345 [Rhodovulum sulfidophilum]|uniref:hypothetical protein n=1 Tax=Rhodovulum sulfidophilum TaxID=35806 RepID=UPI001920D558|nr:hypothetical protein [Rhodovulum sulfidophilum]MBL3575159.1 hypothetical protein [Rhodovulum sulfidophilum]MCE8431491.1 hypothetical protein [Rhodovulum sulfidophilum]MCF4115499.1 hypothetical protein [Rhodovulum sulfidophilum]